MDNVFHGTDLAELFLLIQIIILSFLVAIGNTNELGFKSFMEVKLIFEREVVEAHLFLLYSC